MALDWIPQWASTASALISTGALAFTSITLARTTRNNDLNALIKMNEVFTKATNDFVDEGEREKKIQRFIDVLNIF